MIYLLKEPVTPAQIQEMLQEYKTMIKKSSWIFAADFYLAVEKCKLIANLFFWMTAANRMIFGAQTGIRANSG